MPQTPVTLPLPEEGHAIGTQGYGASLPLSAAQYHPGRFMPPGDPQGDIYPPMNPPPAGLLAGSPPPAGLMAGQPQDQAFFMQLLERLLAQGVNQGAVPKGKGQAPPRPGSAPQGDIYPPMPDVVAKKAIAQSVNALMETARGKPPGAQGQGGPAQGQGQANPQSAELAQLRALIQQQIPTGLKGLMNARGTSTMSLGNMVASGGAKSAVLPGDVLRAQRQEAIGNLSGLQTLYTEVAKAGTAQQKQDLDRLKLGLERGDKRAEVVSKLYNELGDNLTGVADRGIRTGAFLDEARRVLDKYAEESGDDMEVEKIQSLLAPLVQKYSEGAIKEGEPTTANKLMSERDKAAAAGKWKQVAEYDAIIAKMGEPGLGRTEFDAPGKAFTKKVRENMLGLETTTKGLLDGVDTLLTSLESEDTVTSWVGSATQFFNGTAAQIMQAGRAMAGRSYEGNTEADFRNAENNPGVIQAIKAQFGEKAGNSAVFKSNLIRLAYAVGTAARPQDRMTNEDFANAMKQLGDSKDKKVMARVERGRGEVGHSKLSKQLQFIPKVLGNRRNIAEDFRGYYQLAAPSPRRN